jgi:hypothetical protein
MLLGYVYLNRSFAITLTENAVFEPVCTSQPTDARQPSPLLDTRDPFYSSVTPQLYAIGCATVVSYLLVIILLITPRTFYVGGPGGGANFLGRHGMISGSYSGNSSVVGVGGRPWLQKVAAILVAVSLTIASADSFRVAERQYNYGYSDAEALTEEVIDGTEIRVVRVISSTFLWLAQVQTLIRLFPRHKEKIMIKWAGFALIVLDTIFSILDKFLVKTNTTRPRLYDDAIPALSYLFELALNLLFTIQTPICLLSPQDEEYLLGRTFIFVCCSHTRHFLRSGHRQRRDCRLGYLHTMGWVSCCECCGLGVGGTN